MTLPKLLIKSKTFNLIFAQALTAVIENFPLLRVNKRACFGNNLHA